VPHLLVGADVAVRVPIRMPCAVRSLPCVAVDELRALADEQLRLRAVEVRALAGRLLLALGERDVLRELGELRLPRRGSTSAVRRWQTSVRAAPCSAAAASR
jgi:hypothetical protein